MLDQYPDRDPFVDPNVRSMLWDLALEATSRLALQDVSPRDVESCLFWTTLFPNSEDELLRQVTQYDTRAMAWANLSRFPVRFEMPPGCIIIDVTRATARDAAVLWGEIRQLQELFAVRRDEGGQPEKAAVYHRVTELRKTETWPNTFEIVRREFPDEASPSQQSLEKGWRRWKKRQPGA